MKTLFDLDQLAAKHDAPAPQAKPARYWIEVERDGKRVAYMGSHTDLLRYMMIDTSRKQPRPHLYKTLAGAHKANREIKGTVKVWTGSYA